MALVAEFSSTYSPAIRPSPSSLLEATPASIVRALSVAYPLLCCADRILGWLTWSSSDKYESCLVLILFTILIKKWETIVSYWLPLVIAVVISLLVNQSQINPTRSFRGPPTLDKIVAKLESSGLKYRRFVSPLRSLRLNGMEMVRFVLATLLFSPVYALITYLWVTPRNLSLFLGIVVLSWHSQPFKVARSLAWRFKGVRVAVFLVTGIDRSSPRGKKSKDSDADSIASTSSSTSSSGQEVEYTFVIFENQRHWLGIGWTSNMLPEERAAWTDASLNESSPIDSFELPDASGTGMTWHWVEDRWLLDLYGDGSELRQQPGDDEGFVYFNSVWGSPSPVSGFSKYTRRRKWVRRAVLVSVAAQVTERLNEKEQTEVNTKLSTELNTEVNAPPANTQVGKDTSSSSV